MPLTPGTRVGTYEILAPLGAGGMGEVYRARDTRLNRDVAIKVLPVSFADDPDRLARFAREAQMLAALNHPNIAQIYGLEESPSAGSGQAGVRALAMELVEGPTLQERLEAGTRAIPVDEALAITRQICAALEAAHERGIVHRDLKPANIKIRPDGTVKVLDFGLAKMLVPSDVVQGSTMTSPAMTGIGVILGTAAYMAPEQARGRAVDKRADIWALGVILYEMLCGRRAFAGDDVSEVMASVIKSDPDWRALPKDAPPAVQSTLVRCLKKDPAERIRDAGDVRLALEGAFASVASTADAPATGTRWLWPAATAVALLAAAAISVVHFRERAPAAELMQFDAPIPGRADGAGGIPAIAVSPDGRSIAYVDADSSGRFSLWVHSLERGESRQLPITSVPNLSFPFWSPDSRFIAVFTPEKLRKVDVAGTLLQTICDLPSGNAAPRGATWSDDDVIVFSRFGSALARVPAAGGVPVELTRLDVASGEIEHTGPRFLPDNRHFLYNRRTSAVNTGAGVYVGSIDMKPDDARPARLVSTDFIPGYAPGPSPDAGYLLFLRDRTLFAQRFNLGRLVVEGQAVPVLEHVADNGPPFAIFSTSQTGVLAYRRNVATSGTVVWVDRTGREVGPAVTGTLTTPRFPRLSPDGQRLALTVAGDIWVHDIGGRPPIRITSSGGNFETVWSSDGRRLVYETSSGTLSAIAADGSGAAPTPITERGHTHAIGFPRDGQELVAVALGSASTGNDIVGLQVGAKAAPRPIVQTPAREGSDGAALSPDGRWLAYVSDVTGQREIWVQAYPTAGAPMRVSPNGGIEPVWSRKGDELYYLEGTRMMSVAVRPGPTFDFKAAVRLFDSRYEHVAQPPTYDVGADGRFLMIKSERIERPAINVVVNWPELLKGRR